MRVNTLDSFWEAFLSEKKGACRWKQEQWAPDLGFQHAE